MTVNADEFIAPWRGLDWRLTKSLFAGAEATWRDIDVPLIFPDENAAIFEARTSNCIAPICSGRRASRLTLSGQVVYDIFGAERGNLTDLTSTPAER